MKSALIFSAGRGERLYPITRHRPKALCLVQGIPLIEHHIIKLKQAGIEQLFINHAYLGDQIKRHLGNGARFGLEITYLPEPPGGLETGGTLVGLAPHLKQTPVITINADIYTDYDFSKLKAPAPTLAGHLILVPQSDIHHSADFGLSTEGLLSLENRHFIFSGIAIYHPQWFAKEKFRRFSLSPLLRDWAQHQKISGEIYHGTWVDIGTPARLQYLQQVLVTAPHTTTSD